MAIELGQYNFRISEEGGRHFIFDIIRKKNVRLTPEEAVRQSIIHFLVHDKQFPAKYISVEKGIEVNGQVKRTDVVVFSKDLIPKILVECKQPKEQLSESVSRQAANYNLTLQVPWLLLSNGKETLLFEIDHKKRESHLVDNFPLFDDL